MNQRLYKLRSLEDLKPLSYLKIDLSKFYPVTHKERDGESKHGFKLQKNNKTFLFQVHTKRDYELWKNALESCVIQFEIWKYYNFQDKLGEGAFGKVYLA